MHRKTKLILVVLLSIFLSGCGHRNVLLKPNQKDLSFKPEQGGAIFSLRGKTSQDFRAQHVKIQEINQYKDFDKRQLIPIPGVKNRVNNEAYLYGLKLAEGTYRVAGFSGVLGWSEFYLPCDKIIEVDAGRVTYVGRILYELSDDNVPTIKVVNRYDRDSDIFENSYSVLKDMNLQKDIMY